MLQFGGFPHGACSFGMKADRKKRLTARGECTKINSKRNRRMWNPAWRCFLAAVDLQTIRTPAIRLWRGAISHAEKQPSFRIPQHWAHMCPCHNTLAEQKAEPVTAPPFYFCSTEGRSAHESYRPRSSAPGCSLRHAAKQRRITAVNPQEAATRNIGRFCAAVPGRTQQKPPLRGLSPI